MADKTPSLGDLLLLDGVMHRITRLTNRGTVQAEHPDGPEARPRRFCSLRPNNLRWMELDAGLGCWYLPTRMLPPEQVVEAATVTAGVAEAKATGGGG